MIPKPVFLDIARGWVLDLSLEIFNFFSRSLTVVVETLNLPSSLHASCMGVKVASDLAELQSVSLSVPHSLHLTDRQDCLVQEYLRSGELVALPLAGAFAPTVATMALISSTVRRLLQFLTVNGRAIERRFVEIFDAWPFCKSARLRHLWRHWLLLSLQILVHLDALHRIQAN